MESHSDTVTEKPTSPKQRRYSFAFWFAILSITLLGLLLLFPRGGKIIERWRRIDVETAQILWAIQTYKAEFGALAAGDSHAVFRGLRGQNPRQVVFFNCSAESISPDGDLLDPWGTPYKLYFSGDEVIIRSAGPNRQFESSGDKHFDDYIR